MSETMTKASEWLEKAVFYEIYPQSFYDSNGDGIGDIPGIIQKLDYLQSLGVDAVWLNPCFVSPFEDAGYDVSDYYQVAPRYGTNDDLARLFRLAGQRGIRVLLDLVPGHTSNEHPWFKAAAKHERNEYTDWYIWTNSVWETPPAPLQAIKAYAEKDAAYIINFFWMQPALNYGFAIPDPQYSWQQPMDAPGPRAVRQEIKNIMKFWLDKGCSGFRVDMAMSLVKNDPDKRGVSAFWKEVRAWLDQDYPQAALVSEWSDPERSLPAGFHMDFLLHFGSAAYSSLFRKRYGRWMGLDPYGYSFFNRHGHGNIQQFLDEYVPQFQRTKGQGYISLITGNHDIYPRLGHDRDAEEMKVAFTFLLTMPGVPFIYYGDEIGMRGVDGLPSKEGGFHRTASRTPMQWSTGLNAGFSTAQADQLYLPVETDLDSPNVADQDNEYLSLLNTVRRLIRLRREFPALCGSGDFEPVFAVAGEYPLVYKRSLHGQTILVAVNPTEKPVEACLPEDMLAEAPPIIFGVGEFTHMEGGWLLKLPGISSGVYQVT